MSRQVEVTIPVAGSVYRVTGSYEPMVPGVMRQGDGFRHTVDGGFWTDAVLVRLSGRTRKRSLVLDRAAMAVEGSLWAEAHGGAKEVP